VALFDRPLTAEEIALIRDRGVEACKVEAREVERGRGPLAEYGVEEIIFALRQRGKDGHWYANIGYYSFDNSRPVFGTGGKLCRKGDKGVGSLFS
jgi:hypothetical protein